MYKYLTVVNGALLALMIFFNGMISRKVGPIWGATIFHIIGLIIIILIAIAKKNKLHNIKHMSALSFLPGLLSVIIILLNNLCIPKLGVTLTTGTSLFGQLVLSGIVGHFGLFGSPVYRFHKGKLIGFSFIALGVIIMMVV